MDINNNALQYQPTVITPKTDKNGTTPEASVVSFETAKASVVAQAKTPAYSENDLQQAVKKLNDYVQTTNRSIQFSVDHDSGTLVTKVVDSETDKVIWQMPTEETIKLAQSLTSLFNDGAVSIFRSKA